MNILRTMKFLAIAALVVSMIGCGDDTTRPPAPPPPPQINAQVVSGLTNNDVYAIFVDSQGRQWFCTDSGLGMAEANAVANVTKMFDDFDGIPNRKMRAAAELHGKIFVGTWGGGVGVGTEDAIQNDDVKWTVLDEDSGLIANRVFDLAVDDSSLWVATVAGISQYVDDDSRPVEDRWVNRAYLGPNVVSSIVFQVTPTRGPEIWTSEKLRDNAGTLVPGGIRVLTFPGSQHYTTDSSGIPSDDCNEVAYDPVHDLFVSAYATFGIAFVDVDTRTWTYLTKQNGLVSDLGSSVAVTSGGTIWYASQAGLSKISPNRQKITNYIEGSGLPSINARKVYVDPNDQVWAAFVEAGAIRIK